MKNVNVIAHRNKIQKPCIEDWKKYDDYVMNDMMLETGCRPPHWMPSGWNSNAVIPICHNAKQMEKLRLRPSISRVLSLKPPCRSIDRLDYDYYEKDVEDNKQFDTYVFSILHQNNKFKKSF